MESLSSKASRGSRCSRGSRGSQICGLLCLFALGGSLAARQADRTQTEALARRATERLQALEREADRLALEEKTLLGDLRKLEIERLIKAEELRRLDAETTGVESDIAAADSRAKELQRQEEAVRPELRARLVDVYKLGSARYLRLLLSTPDVRRLGEALRAVAALAQLDRNRVAEHRQMLDALQTTRAALDDRRGKLALLRAEAARAESAARLAAQAKNDLIRGIDRRRDLNAQLSGELHAAQQKLQATLRGMATAAPSSPSPASTALPLKPLRGDLDWPLSGTVRRRFDPASPRRTGTANGIEIAAPEGTPARAVHAGVVAFADTFAGFGNLVILDHGLDTFSVYGNLLDIAVKKGARVDRGQTVGGVGAPSAAPAGGSGLYFELRVDGQPVDPLQWFRNK